MYKRRNGKLVIFLVLHVDNTVLIGNNVGYLYLVGALLSSKFDMNDYRKTSHVLGIKLRQDRENRMIGFFKSFILIRFFPNSVFKDSKNAYH